MVARHRPSASIFPELLQAFLDRDGATAATARRQVVERCLPVDLVSRRSGGSTGENPRTAS